VPARRALGPQPPGAATSGPNPLHYLTGNRPHDRWVRILTGTVPRTSRGPRPTAKQMPYIETADGTSLFVTEWGRGAPVVFTHA
jgi:hypothetical protein